MLDAGTARIEVQSLLQHVLKISRAYLLAHPERCMPGRELARYDELLQRRLHGEPLAYILGMREFFGLTFKVTPATLIPRPESELLVELALQRIPGKHPSPPAPPMGPLAIRLGGTAAKPPVIPQEGKGSRQAGKESGFRVLDLGTGSGVIALSIAHACSEAEVWACDASPAALAVALENAQRLGIANASFVQSDWYNALGAQSFDLIVSNPPYVAADDPHLQQGDLRFEPPSALASGDDGLQDIRHIISQAPAHLHPGGWLMFEHGYDQAASVRRLLQEAGLIELFSACDLAGIERVSGGQLA